jgi:hypothetical protein
MERTMGLITEGVMNMPLPDDPADLDVVTWFQIKDRMRDAGRMISSYRKALNEIARQDVTEIALDPDWPRRIAKKAVEE